MNKTPCGPASNLCGIHALVTGVAGFLGRRLAEKLSEGGAQVFGIDANACNGRASGIQCVQTDILDPRGLADALSALAESGRRQTVVFHLAGQSHVATCRDDPSRAFHLNVTGTLNVLEACRKSDLSHVVFPSTALVYAAPSSCPIEEDAMLRPRSVYAATKLATEAILAGYAIEYGFSCRIARLGNVYGAGAASDSVTAKLMRQVSNGGPIALKSLAPVRDFVYLDDVVSGLIALALADRDRECRAFNLSSGTPTSIRELVSAACLACDVHPSVTETAAHPRDYEDRLVLSVDRIRQYTNWRPRWTLEEGLKRTLSDMATVNA